MTTRRAAFARWRRERPFWGAVLIAIGGIEEFFSGQLDIGKIHIQLGLEGLQALVIPIVLVLLAVLIAVMPVHRIFYGVIALVFAVYSLIGVNLGGFIVGMVLAAVGGVLVLSWLPAQAQSRPARGSQTPQTDASPPPAEEEPHWTLVLTGPGHAEPVIPPSLRGRVRGQGDRVEEPPGGDGGEPGGVPRRRRTDESSSEAADGTTDETDDPPRRPRRRSAVRGGVAVVLAATALGVATGVPQAAHAAGPSAQASLAPSSALRSSAAQPSAVQSGCVLLIICSPSSPSPGPSSSPSPSPTPSPSASGGIVSTGPGGPTVQLPGAGRSSTPAPGQPPVTQAPGPSDATTETPLVALGADNDHGVFTLPSANATGDSLQASGISQVGIVTVPLADGSRATAIRIECDTLQMGGFHLDTQNRGAGVNLDTGGMTLSGHATVWIDRIGTQYGDGEGLAQSLAANPLTLGQLMTLLGQGHLVLGLVGAQGDQLSYSSFEESVRG